MPYRGHKVADLAMCACVRAGGRARCGRVLSSLSQSCNHTRYAHAHTNTNTGFPLKSLSPPSLPPSLPPFPLPPPSLPPPSLPPFSLSLSLSGGWGVPGADRRGADRGECALAPCPRVRGQGAPGGRANLLQVMLVGSDSALQNAIPCMCSVAIQGVF